MRLTSLGNYGTALPLYRPFHCMSIHTAHYARKIMPFLFPPHFPVLAEWVSDALASTIARYTDWSPELEASSRGPSPSYDSRRKPPDSSSRVISQRVVQ